MSGHFDTQQCRTRIGERSAQRFLKLSGILYILREDAASIGELSKVRIYEVGTKADDSRSLHFKLHEAERVVLINDNFDRRFELLQGEQFPHQHRQTSVA